MHNRLPASLAQAGIFLRNEFRVPALAPRLGWFALLLALYVLIGITGHEPWKADEAYIFGTVHSMLEDDSWLVPLVAGEPFMEKPPLYAWVAAGLVKLLCPLLSPPDAARLASAGFMTLTLYSLANAAHQCWGAGRGRYAPAILCSCIGILVQSHMMMPDIALLTGISLAVWGFSSSLERPAYAGALIGLGAGVAFLAKGLLGPGVIGLTAVLLPLAFSPWRDRRFIKGLLVAAAVALPLVVVWPAMLYHRSPVLFLTWFWDNNFGRFFGTSVEVRGTEKPPWFWLQTLPWFAFPALPLAIYGLFVERRVFRSHPGLQGTTVLAGVIIATLSFSAAARGVYALPLLAPASVLAVPAVLALGRRFDRAWFFASLMLFGAMAIVLWAIWISAASNHMVPKWSWLQRWLPGDFAPPRDAAAFVIAGVLTVCAAVAFFRFFHAAGCGLMAWMTGITLAWALLMTLHLPWLDFAKSYRTVFGAISWPTSHRCIASEGLGESERAMLDYYADRLTLRREVSPDSDCDLLFVQGFASDRATGINPSRWQMVWSGARPGDASQRFWLYMERPVLSGP